ncbi:MAG: hypothetical protein R2743_03380 [Ilumatobacteraceae bacterium]
MRRIYQAVLVGGVAAAVMVPSTSAFAGAFGGGGGNGGNGTGVRDGTCVEDPTAGPTRDGTGWRHTSPDGTTVEVPGAGRGAEHRSGPTDGSGPRADRALDGTGNRWSDDR